MSIDLDAIKARAAAATEGPWDWWHASGAAELFVPNGTMTTKVVLSFADHLDCEECGRPSQVDAEFIAAARDDVPALVAEVERQAAIIQAVRALAVSVDRRSGDHLDEFAVLDALSSLVSLSEPSGGSV